MTETRTSRRARASKKSRMTTFTKCYLVYLLVIAIALIAVYLNVRSTMVEYENNAPENYVIWLTRNVEKSQLGKLLEDNVFRNPYCDLSSKKAAFYDKCKNAELEATLDTAAYDPSHPTYNITADGKPLLRLQLNEDKTYTKLSIMTLSDWSIASFVVRNPESEAASIRVNEVGTLDCTVTMPGDYNLCLNGADANLANAEVTESALEEFVYIKPFVDVPSGKTVKLTGLCFEPAVSGKTAAGEMVAGTQDASGNWTISAGVGSSDDAQQAFAAAGLDPLEMGKIWSKFMTNDVGGSYRGLYNVRSSCKLLPGSNLYDMATKWAGSIDITFVSGHSIKSWTGDSVKNYTKYSDKLMSCDVYFEKNLVLSNGANRTDVFDNRMFFVYIDNAAVAAPGWYLADMMSIAGTY